MNYSFISRSRILLFCFIFFAFILMVKLFYVQIIHRNFYLESANREYSTPVSDIFERGTIFFQDKDGGLISAATLTTGFKLAIEPTKIKDAQGVYLKLSTILPDINKDDGCDASH